MFILCPCPCPCPFSCQCPCPCSWSCSWKMGGGGREYPHEWNKNMNMSNMRPWSTSSTDVKTTQQRSGLWLDGCSLSPSRDTLETSFLGLTSPHCKLSSTSRTHPFFSMFLTAPLGKFSFYFSRKSRETSSSAELSLLSLDVKRNFNPEFKNIFCQWFPSCQLFWNTKVSWTTPTLLRSFGEWPTLCSMIRLNPHMSFFISSLSSHPLS